MKTEWCGSCGRFTVHLGECCLGCMPIQPQTLERLERAVCRYDQHHHHTIENPPHSAEDSELEDLGQTSLFDGR